MDSCPSPIGAGPGGGIVRNGRARVRFVKERDQVSSAEETVAEARKAFFVVFGALAVVWVLQLINWADGYGLSRHYGLVSRHPSRLPDIFTAPLLHWSWAHIESNSGPLFVFGFLAAYRGVRKFLLLTVLIAVTGGLTVWFLQGGRANTVGASGLVFGYLGYVVVRGLFDRHLIDTLIGVVMAASYAYTFTVVVPGTPGISWLGHLGGFAGGVLGAWLLRDRRPRAVPGDTARPTLSTDTRPSTDLYQDLGSLLRPPAAR